MKKLVLLLFVILNSSIYAQVGIGTTSPSGALEVSSSTDGFLLPRIALTSKNDSTVTTPTVSEIIYNTATAGVSPNDVRPGFYFWNGTSWIEMENASGTKNWQSTGNTGATATTNFLGTTDDVDLNFRRSNIQSGSLGATTTSFGVNSLVANTAIGNTAFGTNALSANTTATGNVAFGYGALQDNAGSDNIDNTAFGFEALRFNNSSTATLAKNNTAIGARTLRANTTGFNNTAIGLNSLTSNTTGMFNTGVGTGTLLSNISGESNTAFGTGALRQNTTGSFNNGIGRGSLFNNTTGSYNTGTGSNTLNANTTGLNNVAIGHISMVANTTGSQNTAVGAAALQNAVAGNNNVAIGYQAAAHPLVSGADNVAIGYQALNLLTSGNNNIGIGKGVELPDGTLSNQIRIGNTDITYAGVQVAWTITSDRRWKSDIKDSDLGLDFIKQLRPVSYARKNDKSKKLEYGFIAQELEQALDKFGATHTGIISKANDGMISVRYNDLLAPMVKAIQEQQVFIEKEHVIIEKQQAIIEKLIGRIEELEKNIN